MRGGGQSVWGWQAVEDGLRLSEARPPPQWSSGVWPGSPFTKPRSACQVHKAAPKAVRPERRPWTRLGERPRGGQQEKWPRGRGRQWDSGCILKVAGGLWAGEQMERGERRKQRGPPRFGAKPLGWQAAFPQVERARRDRESASLCYLVWEATWMPFTQPSRVQLGSLLVHPSAGGHRRNTDIRKKQILML